MRRKPKSSCDAGASAVMVVSSGSYKPFGPLTGLTFGNAVALSLNYDQDYRLTTSSPPRAAL